MKVSENSRQSVRAAIEALGFDGLRAYMLARSGKTLTEMADELGIKHPTFYAVHNEWVDKHAPQLWGGK